MTQRPLARVCPSLTKPTSVSGLIPESMTPQTAAVIRSCRGILGALDALMDRYSPRRHRRALKWALQGKSDASALNRQLEAHTRTLVMTLEISVLATSRSIQADTGALGVISGEIHADTSHLREDTQKILGEIDDIRRLVSNQVPGSTSSAPDQDRDITIEQYLETLTEYAESVVNDDVRGAVDQMSVGTSPRFEEAARPYTYPPTPFTKPKTQSMQTVDAKLHQCLQQAITFWFAAMDKLAEPQGALRTQIHHSNIRPREIGNEQSQLRLKLDRYDNDEQCRLGTHIAMDVPARMGPFFSRVELYKFGIQESRAFTCIIEWNDSVQAHYQGHLNTTMSSNQSGEGVHTWEGYYRHRRAPFFKPRIKPEDRRPPVATTWTTNRLRYADEITQIKRDIGNLEVEMDHLSNVGKRGQEELEELERSCQTWAQIIERAREAIIKGGLVERAVPLRVLNSAETNRYQKTASELIDEDLAEFIRSVGMLDLLEPLRHALSMRDVRGYYSRRRLDDILDASTASLATNSAVS